MLRGEGAPPFRRQIAARVAIPILEGSLAPGTRLPSVRTLAGRLGVGRSTVAASYRELAGRGLVVAEPGSGVFVAGPGSGASSTAICRSSPGGDAHRTEGGVAARGDPLGFLLAMRGAGLEPLEAAGRCALWAAALTERRAAVLATAPALARVVAAELASTLPGGRFRAGTDAPDRTPPADGWLPVRVQPPWSEPPAAPGPIVHLQVGAPFREQVRRLRAGTVLRLLTKSVDVVRLARDTVRERLGAQAAVLAIDPDATDAASRLHPDGLSWVDFETHRAASAAARGCRLLPVVALRSVDELAAVLELEPRHPRFGGRRP